MKTFTIESVLFQDIARTKTFGDYDYQSIHFNEKLTKCKINDFRMRKVDRAFTKQQGRTQVITWTTMIRDERVYFRQTKLLKI